MSEASQTPHPPAVSARESAWRHAVDEGLKGASFEKALCSTSSEGLTTLPLYSDEVPVQPSWPKRETNRWQRHEELELSAVADLEAAVHSALERGVQGLRVRAASERSLERLRAAIGERALTWYGTCGSLPGSAQVSTCGDEARGAGPALQVALALAGGVEHLRAATNAKRELDQASTELEFELGVGGDFFTMIAMLRALRLAWARLVAASGGSERGQLARIHARTSDRAWSVRDPWNNVLRGTTATFAAAVGGADSISTLPYDLSTGDVKESTRRLASNTQALLAQEAWLEAVVDPAAGSGYVEELTEAIARQAWEFLRAIERAGGLSAARQAGVVDEQIAVSANAQVAAVATRKLAFVGVSEFANLDEEWVPNAAVRTSASERLAVPFERLRERSDAHLAQKGVRPSAFLALFGAPHEYRARAGFARNFLAVGGIESIDKDGCADVATLAQAFAASGKWLCVLCSSDERYAKSATELVSALQARGALILLAGHPGERRKEWSEAGVTHFIHLGCNALAILEAVWTELEARA